jgi:hypothetical protein
MTWEAAIVLLSGIVIALLVTNYPFMIVKWMEWKEKRSLKRK